MGLWAGCGWVCGRAVGAPVDEVVGDPVNDLWITLCAKPDGALVRRACGTRERV